jgi:hypothetical protein
VAIHMEAIINRIAIADAQYRGGKFTFGAA